MREEEHLFPGREDMVKRKIRILVVVAAVLFLALALWFASRPAEVQKDPAMQEITRPMGR